MKIVYSVSLDVNDVRWAEQGLDTKLQDVVKCYLDEQIESLHPMRQGTLALLSSTVVKKHSKIRKKLGVDTDESLW